MVPARDEAAAVEGAMGSLLRQDYPDLQVIAVDDRSGDGTREILDRLASADPRLSVVHVRDLPAGWLGKSHACRVGAERTTGRWLLFTDADVHFAPGALRLAVSYAERHGLGHLVVFPELVAPGFWERGFQSMFGLLLCLKLRPWELRRAGSRAFVGVGAFNLVERRAYERVGGHDRLACEVADDVKLGLILRRSGVAQGGVPSDGTVRVRWSAGLGGSFRGLLKNAFAGAEYRWSVVVAACALLLAVGVGPLAGLLEPGVRPLAALALGAGSVTHGLVARRVAGGSGLEGLAFPVFLAALAAVVAASAAVTSLRGGVRWRETFYPLELLRAGCVRESDWPARAAVGW